MNNKDMKEKLRSISFLKALSDDEFDRFVQQTRPCFFKQKTYVFRHGEHLNKIFFILSGTVKIYHEMEGGKEQIVSLLGAGDMFPQMCFLKKDTYPANAQVTEDAQLLFINRKDFEALLLANKELLIYSLRMLGETIVELQSRISEKIFHNIDEQIVLLFIRLCKTNGVRENDVYRLTTYFSNKELANMIGTSSESIGKALQQFQEENAVTVHSSGYFYVNMEKLKQKLAI